MMALLKFIGLFTFPDGGNWNQQGRCAYWCGMQPFVVVWRHFHVVGWNFEGKIFLIVDCDGLLFVCIKLAGVGLNVCQCTRKADSHPGRQSCLTRVLYKDDF